VENQKDNERKEKKGEYYFYNASLSKTINYIIALILIYGGLT
jgi:hypothetical protein